MKISLIAAIASENRALGKDNDLIYKIPEDLKRFKKLTEDHAVIMGRKTYESIGHPLSNRLNIIITHNPFKAKGVFFASSLEEALKIASQGKEIFIIGGGQIYKEAIGLADKLYLTVVEGNPKADTFFPDYSDFKKVVFEESHESNGLKYKFLDIER